jgi:hypothetical protein
MPVAISLKDHGGGLMNLLHVLPLIVTDAKLAKRARSLSDIVPTSVSAECRPGKVFS